MRKLFFSLSVLITLIIFAISVFWKPILYLFIIVLPLIIQGFVDIFQTRHTIRRNFPVIGHGRYLLEMIRPEIFQYFIESNADGRPFSREDRSVVYQRAKGQLDTLPFGTQNDVYEAGYEWINHSIAPLTVTPSLASERVEVGGKSCTKPYSASLFNISAMSFGSLSKNAILALNRGARMGGFAHNTGEGGISPYHLEPGGDLIWQVGTGYFGCRDKKGKFNSEEFIKRATLPCVKMIEIKISQGAKPGHGGILPAKKLTPEIAAIRGVELGHDVISPPAHSAFSNPIELLEFIERLRIESTGKPIGIKICMGKRHQFLAIIKAMLQTQILPDFITVDGAEGGTGAAPLEFSNHVGTPLNDGLAFIHNSLIGAGLRNKIHLIAAAKITTGFHMAKTFALGADLCNSARGMMFALGCIQALRCNTNACPTGVATQDPELVRGLYVKDKAKRVANYHRETMDSFFEILAAAGLTNHKDLKPWHIQRRVGPNQVRNYHQIYSPIEPGSLLSTPVPDSYKGPWEAANPLSFI